MALKEKNYTLLSKVDHKMQYVSIIAVINVITPTIKRKKLTDVVLEVSDSTMHNPGFHVTLKMNGEVLSQFIDIARRGLLIELLEIKIIKNEGAVYGQVVDEDEVKLYNDRAENLKWHSEEKASSISDMVKTTIKELLKWKKKCFLDTVAVKNSDKDCRTSRHSDASATVHSDTCKTPLKEFNKEYNHNQSSSSKGSLKTKRNIEKIENHILTDNQVDETKTKSVPNLKTREDSANISLKPTPNMSDVNVSNNNDVKVLRSNKSVTTNSGVILNNKQLDLNSNKSNSTSITIISSSPNKKIQKEMKKNNVTSSSKILEDKYVVGSVPDGHSVNKRNPKEGKPTIPMCNNETHSVNYDTELSVRKNMGEVKELLPTNLKSLAKSISHKIGNEYSSKNPVSITKSEKSCTSLCTKTSKCESLNRDQVKDKILIEKENKTVEKKGIPLGNKAVESSTKSDSSESKKYSLRNNESESTQDCTSDSYVEEKCFRKRPKSTGCLNKKTPPLNVSDSSISTNSTSPEYSTACKNTTLAKPKPIIATARVIDNKCFGKNQTGLICNEKEDKTTLSVIKKKQSDKLPADQSIEILKEIKLSSGNVQGFRKKTQTFSEEIVKKNDDPKVISDKKTNKNEKTMVELKNSKLSMCNNNSEVNKRANTDKTIDKQLTYTCSLTSPRNHGQQNNGTVLEDKKQKYTRSSMANQVEADAQSVKSSPNRSSVFWYLKEITRNVSLRYAKSINEVSICEIEEIDVPEKFDLECKVLLEFTLIEDGIQVVRVQDGSICKAGSLIIPETSSWNGVIDRILKNPVVKKNSPFIDLIIFDFTRMQTPVIAGQFVIFQNVMAVKFQLKDDPRQEMKNKGELFFCTEGQNTYTRKLFLKAREKIEEKLNNITYKNTLKKFCDDKEVSGSFKDLPSVHFHDEDPMKEPPKTNKRKFTDSQLHSKAASPKKIKQVVDTGKEPEIKNHPEFSVNKNKKVRSTNLKAKLTNYGSSDETVFDETPAVLKEISEIMHEESAFGLPLTESEDIHLKNSGSEVSFSQFCREAKSKAANFRSSTQEDSLLGDIVRLTGESGDLEDTGEMEPLTYCPSGSSVSSVIDISPVKRRKLCDKFQHLEDSCESIFRNYEPKTGVEVDSHKLRPENIKKESKDNSSEISNSSSIKVISSNSSDLEFQVVGKVKVPNIDKCSSIEASEKKRNINYKESSCNLSPKQSSGMITEKQMSKESFIISDSLQKNNESIILDSKVEESREDNRMCSNPAQALNSIERNKEEQIEVVSDDSSNLSFFSIENYQTPFRHVNVKTSVHLPSPLKKHSFVQIPAINSIDPQKLQRIPEKFCFKSTKNSTKEELKTVSKDEFTPNYPNQSSLHMLPALSFHVLKLLMKMNSVTIKVTIASITPKITDSWKENCIKSRCPSCKKLYDVFNAANNIYDKKSFMNSALSVGSHIVCPDSQCCNQILDTPEFHFCLELRLRDGTSVTGYIADKHAENIFGCAAQETLRNESKFNKVKEVLDKLSRNITNLHPIKIDITREDLCNPDSGPLFIQKIYF